MRDIAFAHAHAAGTRTMRTITLEEHFATWLSRWPGPGTQRAGETGRQPCRKQLVRDLCDLGEGRIAQMDAGIDMQLLSLTAPGVEQLEAREAVAIAHDTNDALANAIARYPKRLSGLAALPIAAPDQAVKELDRRIGSRAFCRRGDQRPSARPLSRRQVFWPVAGGAAEDAGAPIYLHPTRPPS